MDSALNNAAVDKMDLNRDAWLPPDTSAYDEAVEAAINELIDGKTIDYLDGKVDNKTWEAILKALEKPAREIVDQDIEDARWERESERQRELSENYY